MKILQAFPIFSPSYGTGARAVGYALAKALSERGHDVSVYSTDLGLEWGAAEQEQGIKVYPFHIWLGLNGVLLAPGLIREARRALGDFDIIHMHDYRDFQTIVLHHYARKYGVPYIVDAHGSVSAHKKVITKQLFDAAFGKRLLRDANRVVAETQLGVSEYAPFGVDPDRVVLLYPPFPVEDYVRLPAPGRFRQRYNVSQRHIVTYLGRINWLKGVDFLVQAFAELARSRNDVLLAMVGPDDGYQANVEKLVEQEGLRGKVLFTGFLGGEDKQAALVDASVLVVPSVYEQGLAWASLEALLCGTPIIVSKGTGAAEDVQRLDAGYLVEYGNNRELAATMAGILDAPQEAAAKTQKAREYIMTNMSLRKRVEEYEKLYLSCIQSSRRNGGARL